MVNERRVTIKLELQCCIEEAILSSTHEILEITLNEKNPKFKTSLDVWVKEFLSRKEVIEYLESLGTNKCHLISGTSSHICDGYIISIVDLFQEAVVTGATYRILRMAARGKQHIYGLSDSEFYKRMSERREKYTHSESDQLLKVFKQGLITTTVKI